MGLALDTAVRTDAGPARANNEDALFASCRMVAVADGVGGGAAGEVASRTVIYALAHLEKCRLSGSLVTALNEAVAAGNDTIRFIADCRPETAGMGTTLTAVALDDDYVIANIGDSRAYLYRDGVLTRLTRDDSYVQSMLDGGHLDEAGARNHPLRSVVMKALDGHPRRAARMATHPAKLGDRLLVCSDGLTDFVDETTLRRMLAIRSPARCAEALVESALAARSSDNVSVVVADVVPADEPAIWS